MSIKCRSCECQYSTLEFKVWLIMLNSVVVSWLCRSFCSVVHDYNNYHNKYADHRSRAYNSNWTKLYGEIACIRIAVIANQFVSWLDRQWASFKWLWRVIWNFLYLLIHICIFKLLSFSISQWFLLNHAIQMSFKVKIERNFRIFVLRVRADKTEPVFPVPVQPLSDGCECSRFHLALRTRVWALTKILVQTKVFNYFLPKWVNFNIICVRSSDSLT